MNGRDIKNNETVCAVVVTYNRKNLLLECLEAIKKQTRPVDAIYLIDNASTDGTPELLKEKGYISELPPIELSEPWEKEFEIKNYTDGNVIKFHYVRMNENTGGAGGFYEGLKRAYEKGYDWFWLMDDDCEPIYNGLANQIAYRNIALCIHPSKMYADGKIFIWEGLLDERTGYVFHYKGKEDFRETKSWTNVNFGCFEGMLIHRSVVEKIGFPKKEFFLYGDDTYYGYLASKFTQNIYIREFCIIKKKYSTNNLQNSLNVYLFSRNIIGFLSRKIAKNKNWNLLFTIFLLLLFSWRYIIRFKFKLLYWLWKGYLDGRCERWGKEKILVKKFSKI
ncbi:MAG: glycosyltransferase family 2 protein [Endomicrobia bacterium]|nr:glycosyltransferase family 2 protein [Candidatus Aenigmarchaeota archaeon]MCX7910925.1 glycosyltransferase family 2 protein [Endomicrobiia bacterium]MDW8149039.1 glycosyltransferase family 2 protein [Candidatus Aenigmarchaeota archaeon]